MGDAKKSALFVCLGNICRSPIAEAVFMDEVKKAGQEDKWDIDSAAIGGWHVGNNPDHRARETMAKHNLPYSNRARQIKKEDFNKFNYIFGMDRENISDLNERAPSKSTAKILLLGDFDPEGQKIIRDPYYDSGSDGFEQCYVQCVRSCKAFLKQATEGNSCRSPMAEAVMKNLLPQSSTWEVDSAAIASWNVGLPPEPRCMKILDEHGIETSHIARQVTKADFYRFDFIFGMDPRNVEDLERLAPPDSTAKIELLGRYDSERDNIILDPYFETGDHGFRRCFEQISRSCVGFLRIHGVTRSCHTAD